MFQLIQKASVLALAMAGMVALAACGGGGSSSGGSSGSGGGTNTCSGNLTAAPTVTGSPAANGTSTITVNVPVAASVQTFQVDIYQGTSTTSYGSAFKVTSDSAETLSASIVLGSVGLGVTSDPATPPAAGNYYPAITLTLSSGNEVYALTASSGADYEDQNENGTSGNNCTTSLVPPTIVVN